jgi:hypothetical protein
VTGKAFKRLSLVVLIIVGLSLFAPPQVNQILKVGPDVARAAACDNGDPNEQNGLYTEACNLTLPSGPIFAQSIRQTADRGCYWDYGGATTVCNAPNYYYDADIWLISVGPLVQINASAPSSSSGFNVVLRDLAQVDVPGCNSGGVVSCATPATPAVQYYYLVVYNTNSAPTPGTCSTIPYVPPFTWGPDTCGTSSAANFDYNLIISATPPPTATPTPTPTPLPVSMDGFEPNNTQFQATSLSGLPGCTTLNNLTISPPGDVDYFMFNATPGVIRVTALSSFGMNLNMAVTQTANGTPFAVTANGSPNPIANGTITDPGFTLIQINAASVTALGIYALTVCNTPPPTATPTPTQGPTPTLTPTPNQGNAPDVAEQNNDFPTSFRLAPGNNISLNFNSGIFGLVDVDYFVMKVKPGVTYTCQTSNLGTGADTAMSVYGPDPNPAAVLGANDDINAQLGQVASKVTWTSAYDGDAYIVVSQAGALTVPGNATYTLTCGVGTGTTTTTGASPGGGGVVSGPVSSSASQIQLVGTPTVLPTSIAAPIVSLTINIVVAYDENANGVIDLTEGVSNMSIRATNPNTNKELTHGFTDLHGGLTLVIAAPEDQDILAVIPFLSIGKKFPMSSGAAEWYILLPASSLPGVIP